MASQLYRLEWYRRVRRQFQAVPTRIRQDVKQFVLDLRIHPYADPSESLNRELADLRRIKIDGWRIIYKVNEADRVVRVLAVKQRGPDTYTTIF